MLFFLLLATAALATPAKRSGREVDIANPDDCDNGSGYLSAEDQNQGTCCQFIACNNANLNKTGFLGTCMGGTVWNQDVAGCDSDKYVDGCSSDDCGVVAKRTGAPCENLPADQCCAGPGEGNEPIFNADDQDPTRYRVEGDPWWAACPEGTEFDLDECSCLSTAEAVAPCDEEGDYFRDDTADEHDYCCGYLQCWANRTGVYKLMCMGGSQWNDVNKTCDLNSDDMDACMNLLCDPSPTVPTCDGVGGACCYAGNGYDPVDGDANQYLIVDGPFTSDRVLCCPKNMAGDLMDFNSTDGVCCCEDPIL